MARNLIVDNPLNTTPQRVSDQDGAPSELHLTVFSDVAVGADARAESGLSVVQTPASRRAHVQFGDPNATAGEPSAKLSFAGFGVEHAGFVWVPNGQLT